MQASEALPIISIQVILIKLLSEDKFFFFFFTGKEIKEQEGKKRMNITSGLKKVQFQSAIFKVSVNLNTWEYQH